MKRNPIKLSEVIHLYIGQEFQYQDENGVTYKEKIHFIGASKEIWSDTDNYDVIIEFDEIDTDIKLRLYSKEDMTFKHKLKYHDLCKKIYDSNGVDVANVDTPRSLLYAANKGYDMFDLIENKFAVNKKEIATLNPEMCDATDVK